MKERKLKVRLRQNTSLKEGDRLMNEEGLVIYRLLEDMYMYTKYRQCLAVNEITGERTTVFLKHFLTETWYRVIL